MKRKLSLIVLVAMLVAACLAVFVACNGLDDFSISLLRDKMDAQFAKAVGTAYTLDGEISFTNEQGDVISCKIKWTTDNEKIILSNTAGKISVTVPSSVTAYILTGTLVDEKGDFITLNGQTVTVQHAIYAGNAGVITPPSGDNTGDNTGGNQGGNQGGNTGDNTGGNTGDNTGGNQGGNTGTGGNQGGNTGDNTGGNTGDNTGDNTGNQGGTTTPTGVTKVAAANVQAGVAYKLVFEHSAQSGKKYYILNKMADAPAQYYVAATDDLAASADIYAEAVTGGYKLYFLTGTAKNYLGAQKDGTHNNILLNHESVWIITDECIYTTVTGGTEEVFLGTKTTSKTATFSVADKSKYLNGSENAIAYLAVATTSGDNTGTTTPPSGGDNTGTTTPPSGGNTGDNTGNQGGSTGDNTGTTNPPTGAQTETIVIATYAAANSWGDSATDNKLIYTAVNGTAANITLSTTSPQNPQMTGRFWSSTQWRVYRAEGATIKIEGKSGYTLVSVKITYTPGKNGTLVNDGNNVASDAVINITGNSITLSLDGGDTGKTNGQVFITAIEIVYTAA